jgi:hypothetical protein
MLLNIKEVHMKIWFTLIALMLMILLMAAACGDNSTPPISDEPMEEVINEPEPPTQIPSTVDEPKSVDDSSAENAAVMLRFYYDITEANPSGQYADFSYLEKAVYGEDWLEQALQLMNQYTRFEIGGIWYDGARLYADLIVDSLYGATWQALQGSTGAWINSNILLLNLAAFPATEEIVILINGENDVFSDHFSFEGVFIATGNHAPEVSERIQQVIP